MNTPAASLRSRARRGSFSLFRLHPRIVSLTVRLIHCSVEGSRTARKTLIDQFSFEVRAVPIELRVKTGIDGILDRGRLLRGESAPEEFPQLHATAAAAQPAEATS